MEATDKNRGGHGNRAGNPDIEVHRNHQYIRDPKAREVVGGVKPSLKEG